MPDPVDRTSPEWIGRNDVALKRRGVKSSYKLKDGPKLTHGANKRSHDGPLKMRDAIEMVEKMRREKVRGNLYDKVSRILHVSSGNISRWLKNRANIFKQAGEIEAFCKNLLNKETLRDS